MNQEDFQKKGERTEKVFVHRKGRETGCKVDKVPKLGAPISEASGTSFLYPGRCVSGTRNQVCGGQ